MAFKDFADQLKLWPLQRKITLVLVILLSFAGMGGIMIWSERIDYQVLYSNLGQEDAGQVVGKLKEIKVPFRVEGNVIYVPSNKVYELRLELASQGIPQGGGVGFEIFDKTQIGVTEFVQRLNYRRALQGELSRTIKQLSEVEQCRVHVAIPERTIFTEKEERPTASVVVKLKAGRVLTQGQIGGIVHLIASSVEGMFPRDVTVIDNMGNLLSKPTEADTASDSRQLDYQKSIDKDYESKLQSMLEGIIGRGKAIVRVATKIDRTQIERTEEKFDPDTIAVRSEQRTQDKSTGGSSGGIPGVLSNQPGQKPAAGGGSSSTSQKLSENINYEVSKSVSRIIQPRGEIKNISVAVLVDGTYKKEKDKNVYVPRTEGDIKKYEDIIKGAIGYNKDRGDQVIVENVPFETAIEELPPEKTDYLKIALSLAKFVLPILVVIMLFLFVVKPVIETLKAPVRIVSMPGREAPEAMPGVARSEGGVGGGTPESVVKEEVLQLVKQDPRQAAAILKDWMSE